MRLITASELLDIWELGLTQQPIHRAQILAAAACPDTPPESLFDLSIGERDTLLLMFREQIFGQDLVSFTSCPSCSDRIELNFKTSDIRESCASLPPGNQKEHAEHGDGLMVRTCGFEVRFRLPNSADLEALGEISEAAASRKRLMQGCILGIRKNGKNGVFEELPEEVIEAIVTQMARVDPMGELKVSVSCPQCAHSWQSSFDVVAFLWSEICAWAQRTIREVHILAAAYGWREPDILAMSAWRRQLYLEIVAE